MGEACFDGLSSRLAIPWIRDKLALPAAPPNPLEVPALEAAAIRPNASLVSPGMGCACSAPAVALTIRPNPTSANSRNPQRRAPWAAAGITWLSILARLPRTAPSATLLWHSATRIARISSGFSQRYDSFHGWIRPHFHRRFNPVKGCGQFATIVAWRDCPNARAWASPNRMPCSRTRRLSKVVELGWTAAMCIRNASNAG